MRAAFAREQLDFDASLLADIAWVLPSRPLTAEIGTVLELGYLRGAGLWHIATALYATEAPSQVAFVTLDERQRSVAAELGFQV